MSDPPWLWLLAGPNGAGKSTYAPKLAARVEEIVRPDELATQLSPGVPENAALGAGRLAIPAERNLAVVRQHANRILVLDNSSARRPMRRVLEVNRGEVVFRAKRFPKWLGQVLVAISAV
jgi:predicted ABC-type ATPase